MLFLLEYERRGGRIVTLQSFADAERAAAEAAKLQLELQRTNDDGDREIVLLQARSEKALRVTHRRYFESARQIVESSTS